MTPEAFIQKWRAATLTERAASQSHFIDLCALLGEPAPTDADPTGEHYAFERGASKTAGGEGWADVWKRGHFAWEYKGKRKDLRAAYAQLQQYAVALENPPLLVACDMEAFEVHTNWTNTVHEVHRIGIEDLREARHRATLKAVFGDPERLRPGQTRQALTERAAREFAGLALRLRARGHDAGRVAHFVNRLVFCMFAEDVGLLPGRMFQRMLEQGARRPDRFAAMAAQLFGAMRDGGLVGFEEVAWFNGGLFDDADALPVEREDIEQALAAARLDWAEIDPSILGTLFERGLDPDKRSQLGAHYTDRDKIMLIVEPVIVAPLTREWEVARESMRALLERAERARSPAAATRARNEAQALYIGFLERLRRFRVLDPACGSGNFLYLALLALKELEHRVNLDAEALGFPRQFPAVGPEAVRGIEINPYAAELARVSVWIGEIQWMRRNGFDVSRSPILRPLDTIECRDAVLSPDGSEAEWPEADVVIGNPPFLGCKLMFGALGRDYTTRLRAAYAGRVSGFADLVCFWFEKARSEMVKGRLRRAGLVATNSITGGRNRQVLDRIAKDMVIFEAWSDEPWVVEGAAVRVSLIGFAKPDDLAAVGKTLDGSLVDGINADLTARIGFASFDLAAVVALSANHGIAMNGIVKGGRFDVPGKLARAWLTLPTNPNGRPNSDVLSPWPNGEDVTGRNRDMWLIDFAELTEDDAALYEAPFAWVVEHVRPERLINQAKKERTYWWRLSRPGLSMKSAIRKTKRFIATPEVSKYRIFVWLQIGMTLDKNIVIFARDDDATLGVLHSRFHETWSLRLCTWIGVGNDPRYTSSTTFRTYPFPDGLTPNIPAADYATDPRAVAIAEAAKRLNELRENWLNPPDLVRRVPEVVPGYPDRLLPVDERAAAILKKRTLTNLYNERPTWLANAHRALDEAVAAAYGWPADMGDEEILRRLFELNRERAAGQATR